MTWLTTMAETIRQNEWLSNEEAVTMEASLLTYLPNTITTFFKSLFRRIRNRVILTKKH